MDYFEFLFALNALYRKYFNESNGVKNSLNPDEMGYIGMIVDTLTLKMPKGLEGKGSLLVSCSRKEYEEKGIYASLKVKGEFFIHEKGKTKLLTSELIDEKWTGTYKTTGLLKKFDGLFKEMLKLLTGKRNDKMNKVSKIVFEAEADELIRKVSKNGY